MAKLSLDYLKRSQRGICVGIYIILLCLPPIIPNAFPVEIIVPPYVQSAWDTIQTYCVPGAAVMIENTMFQTAYGTSKQPIADCLTVIFSKTGPTPGAGIHIFMWSTNDWGKAATVYMTSYVLPVLVFPALKTFQTKMGVAQYVPVYGQDYCIFGWYPGDLVVGSAIADNVHGFLQYDYQGTPIAQLPVMNGINTGADVKFDYHLGTTGFSEAMVFYPRYKTPVIGSHSASSLSMATNYWRTGVYKGAVMDMQGAAQFEQIAINKGVGGLTGLGIIAAKGAYIPSLYGIALVIVANIIYWRRRLAISRSMR